MQLSGKVPFTRNEEGMGASMMQVHRHETMGNVTLVIKVLILQTEHT